MNPHRWNMATLGSFENGEGYTKTAQLVSDQNPFPGISIVQFGDSINRIEFNQVLENRSVLKLYEDTVNLLSNHLSYEEISGVQRELKVKVPLIALRETVVNAIAHRDWSIMQPVQIEIHPDKISVLSPGGLLPMMSEEEYLNSGRSIPRNTQLTIIFLRLKRIEKLGTGLRRVREAYRTSNVQPVFRVFPNSVQVILPFQFMEKDELSREGIRVLETIRKDGPLKRRKIEEVTGYSQSMVTRILKDLLTRGLVIKKYSGPKTEYEGLCGTD